MRGIAICASIFLIFSGMAYADMGWKKISTGIGADEFNSVAEDDRDADTIYAGTTNGAYKTTDGGVSWRRIFTGWGPRKNVRQVYPCGGEIFLCTDRGLMLGGGNSGAWKALHGIASESAVISATVLTSGRKTIYIVTKGGVFKSFDGEKEWRRIMSGGTDEGETDEYPEEAADENGCPEFLCIAKTDRDPSRLYMSTREGVYFSDDGGKTKTLLTDEGLPDKAVYSIAESPDEGGTLYAVTKGGVFYLKDAWQQLQLPAYIGRPVSIAFGARPGEILLATKRGIFISGEYSGNDEAAKAEIDNIMDYFSDEPTIRQVQERAVTYGEVHPYKIANWRTRANMSAILPSLSFGLDRDKSKSLHWDSGTNPDVWTVGPEDESLGWDIALSWDLSELIWNPDQTSIDVRSKLMVQLRDDIIDEVTGYYFERRKLQLEMLKGVAHDIGTTIDKELRIQELTAHMDALTGGYFCRALEKKR